MLLLLLLCTRLTFWFCVYKIVYICLFTTLVKSKNIHIFKTDTGDIANDVTLFFVSFLSVSRAEICTCVLSYRHRRYHDNWWIGIGVRPSPKWICILSLFVFVFRSFRLSLSLSFSLSKMSLNRFESSHLYSDHNKNCLCEHNRSYIRNCLYRYQVISMFWQLSASFWSNEIYTRSVVIRFKLIWWYIYIHIHYVFIYLICNLKLICVYNLIKQQTVYGVCDCLICWYLFNCCFVFITLLTVTRNSGHLFCVAFLLSRGNFITTKVIQW